MYNPLYAWQKKQDKQSDYRVDPYLESIKQVKKSLSKKLRAQQYKNLIHDMDKEMFDTICKMLTSDDAGNIEMAREIIYQSKLFPYQINELVQTEKYRVALIWGHTPF